MSKLQNLSQEHQRYVEQAVSVMDHEGISEAEIDSKVCQMIAALMDLERDGKSVYEI